MRTPEHRAQPRAGKKFEAELEMHYLSPGAFTVLPLDMDRIPDPPTAPPPYRLPQSHRRHRHQSFAIIGEPTSSSQNSRSSSPTVTSSGRVSPFKGRGFNPTGSRHASPSTSPVPPQKTSTSKIPRRKSSTGEVFGEKVSHVSFRGLSKQASQSLTSLEERQKKRPPPSPRKRLKGAFKELSPIQGSSPEPSQSLSSPSRIPKSNSTPASRLTSPTRSKFPVKSQAKSRDPSPKKIPCNRYQHVQSKVNSFNKPKPLSTSEDSEVAASSRKKKSFNRTSSRPNLLPKTFMGNNYNNASDSSDALDVQKPKTVSAKSFGAKVNNNSAMTTKNESKTIITNNNEDVKQSTNKKADELASNKTSTSKTNQVSDKVTSKTNQTSDKTVSKTNQTSASDKTTSKTNQTSASDKTTSKTNQTSDKVTSKTNKTSEDELPNKNSSSEEVVPIAKDVVSSTTTTITKPLKIETPNLSKKPISPLIDGRVLSATSVSQAINKMNDTVLNTQTLIKDSGLQNRLNDSKLINNNNHHLGNNKLLDSMESSLASTPVSNSKKSANDRILEARTVIAADVKPIRITVREKPSEVDVQSGNVAHFNVVSNGIGERNNRPSLPPQQPPPPPPPEEIAKEEPPPNRCKRFFETCTRAFSCQKCKNLQKIEEEATKKNGCFNFSRQKKEENEAEKNGCFKCFSRQKKEENESAKTGCFTCFSRQKKEEEADAITATRAEQVRISIEDEQGKEVKRNLWQKLNCCNNKNKIRDKESCLPLGKRKESWVQRKSTTESFLDSEIQQKTKCCSKQNCNNFFRKIFCCCRKKSEPPPAVAAAQRKASMMSGKKKSLTPTSVPPPPEDTRPKIDGSLVEHTSHMKGAIPVLPVWLAWFCCMMNCIGPGTGTILSGLFCLCLGKPRFSQKDGPKARIGAFIIDLMIGCSQFFTVLFCLVGWGWSVWWGVIMVKVARKHRKFRHLEKLEENAGKPQLVGRHQKKDTERGRS